MELADHIEALRRESELLARAAHSSGMDTQVPSCPGWQVRDLLRHICGVHRWAASFLRTGRLDPYTAAEEDEFFVDPGDVALLDRFRTGYRALITELTHADPGLRCFTFLPAPNAVAFWARRQAHETAIHRADAELASVANPMRLTPYPAGLAADGVDELLAGFFAREHGPLVADPPVSMAVAATDAPAAWTVHIGTEHRRVARARQEADLTIEGRAHDLYLLLWNRADTSTCRLRGDENVLDLWHSRAHVVWS